MWQYFKLSEFTCKCGCGTNNIDEGLVLLLDELRERMGMPVVIASGCRCEAHNASVGGKPDSAHLNGFAVDIRALSSPTRYKLITIAIDLAFVRVGIANTYIHLDIDFTKPQEVVWVY